MIEAVLFWIYLSNLLILIIHEIDSAYWQEWKLLDPEAENGINGFLLVHFPLLFPFLYGLVLLERGSTVGYIISFVLAVCGIFAFFFHFYHLKKGREEFNTWLSKAIIISTLVLSIFQIVITIAVLHFQ